jgi:hypothetical protein
VVQTATLDFCDFRMAEWELVCLRGEWAGGIVLRGMVMRAVLRFQTNEV